MITPNRHYALPNKIHDVVDDINELRSTFGKIDGDIKTNEDQIEELEERVSDLENRVIHFPNSESNTEIQNFAANRYLIVNQDGDGLECLEGGGNAGGKLNQSSIKKSDRNFDTAWGDVLSISKNGVTIQENSETSQGNEVHILVNEVEIENDEQLPKVELTNCRAKSDLVPESNLSVIFCDEIEEVEEEPQIATNLNYGFIKVGNGISVDDGIISAPIITKATENNAGIIKTGDGLINESGKISRAEIEPATFSNFGVIKLGDNLSINSNGEMEIDEMANAATIYNLGNVKICSDGIVELEEKTLIYRLLITEDLVIHFRTEFESRADFSFVLELVSDGTHLVAFNENLNPKMNTLPINRGTTKIKFTKKQGVPSYDFEISRLDAPNPILLTPNYGDDINSNLMVTHNGSDWNAHDMLKTSTNDMNFWGREFFFEFSTLVVVDYIFCHFRYSNNALGEFWLKASNDKKNWTMLLYKNNETINGNIPTEIKGCFRYFKLYLGWKNENYPRGFQLWGTQIDNNESELVLLTPTMSSNETGFAKLTYSNLHENGASQLTDTDANSYIYVKYSEDTTDLFRWIKYEFPEAVVANLLDVAAFRDNLERTMRWYKLEGSNDDETWSLLLERQYQRNFTGDETRWHEFENTTAYKFYKLTCLATNGDQYWRIGRFRLFRRDVGKHNFYRAVPKLSSENQDGYKVTASSYYGSHHPYHAFDDSSGVDNKWLSNSGDVNGAWLKIELPDAIVINTFQIQSPNEEYRDRAPKRFKIQGSNDDSDWEDLVSESDLSWSNNQARTWSIENTTAFKFFRILIEENNGAEFVDIGEFFLGNTIYEYKRYLDKYDYLVPVLSGMTTNASDGTYVVSASACDEYGKVWYPFSRSHNSFLELGSNTSGWIKIQLPEARVVNSMRIGSRNDSYAGDTPRNYSLYGSNDGATWDILFSVENSDAWSSSELRRHDFGNETAYLYYRLNFSNPSLRSVCSIARWELMRHCTIQEY
jgi:hypothetical protein